MNELRTKKTDASYVWLTSNSDLSESDEEFDRHELLKVYYDGHKWTKLSDNREDALVQLDEAMFAVNYQYWIVAKYQEKKAAREQDADPYKYDGPNYVKKTNIDATLIEAVKIESKPLSCVGCYCNLVKSHELSDRIYDLYTDRLYQLEEDTYEYKYDN